MLTGLGLIGLISLIIIGALGLRLASHLGSVSFGSGPTQPNAWATVRAAIPARIPIFRPTWLPSAVSHSPSGSVAGGGGAFGYAVWYMGNRSLWPWSNTDLASINVSEGTGICPQCHVRQLRADNALLPSTTRHVLPHAQLFVRRQAPELVLEWTNGGYAYAVEGHRVSLTEVIRVATSLRRVR